MTTFEIIALSDQRLQELKSGFDPDTGEGSFIKRFPFKFTPEGKEIYLPNSLCKEYAITGSLQENCNPKDFSREVDKLITMRLSTDFEYWAAKCAWITDKESERIIPFILNRAQRRALGVMHDQIDEGKPIRIIMLKSRQNGLSTFKQLHDAFIQIEVRENWHSTIVADVEGQTRNIRAMYSRMLKRYPLAQYTYTSHEGSTKNKIIQERGCVHSIGSFQQPDSLRSSDIRCVHYSEVGKWQATHTKSPEDVIAAVSSAVPPLPWTSIAIESTAAGVANYFHRQWLAAEKGEGMSGIFIPWYENTFDVMDFDTPEDKIRLAENLTEHEQWMFNEGATLEGINWYQWKLKTDMGGDEDLMKQENPTNPQEAFQSTGRPAYKAEYIKNLEATVKDPSFIGDVQAESETGPLALENVEFVAKEKGRFKIWSKPNDPPVDKGWVFNGTRYVITLDIGGVSRGSDYSAVSVLDRYWLAAAPGDGRVEKVAQWHGHLDPDLMAWMAAMIAQYYEGGVLVIENNTYDSRYQKTDGEHSFTVLDEIANFYPNLYSSTPLDQIRSGTPKKYGFRTDINTKPMVVNFFRQLARSKSIIERNIEAVQEARNYEITDKGKFSAVPGNHDDIHMADIIGYWVACSDNSPLGVPSLEKEEVVRRRLDRENVRSHASF